MLGICMERRQSRPMLNPTEDNPQNEDGRLGLVVYANSQSFTLITRPNGIVDFPLGGVVVASNPDSGLLVYGMVTYAETKGDELFAHTARMDSLDRGGVFADHLRNRSGVRTEVTCIIVGSGDAQTPAKQNLPSIPPLLLTPVYNCEKETLTALFSDPAYIPALMDAPTKLIPIPLPHMIAQHLSWLNSQGMAVESHMQAVFSKTRHNPDLAFSLSHYMNIGLDFK